MIRKTEFAPFSGFIRAFALFDFYDVFLNIGPKRVNQNSVCEHTTKTNKKK